jgi:hypothetical protein
MKRATVKLLVIIAALTVLSSCFSLIESAVEGAVAKETEEAITGSGSQSESQQATASEPASGAEAGDASAAPAAEAHGIAGTWVNPDYNDEGRSARLVYTLNADGTYAYLAFARIEGGEVYEGTVEYLKVWTDEQGRSCGQSIVTLGGMSWDTLDRIASDGSTLEVQSGVDRINPNGPRYSIYYRP